MDLMSYLFGDILAVSGRDLIWIYGGGGAVLITTALIWRPLLPPCFLPTPGASCDDS